MTRLRNLGTAKYSADPLARALDSEFEKASIGDVHARGKYVLAPAFCLTNGEPRVFKTDHNRDLSGHSDYLLRDVALASCAAPTYFPVHPIVKPTTGVKEEFCDGGVFSNDPSLLGYVEAVTYLGQRPENVRVLSVSTPRAFLGARRSVGDLNWGVVKWGLRGVPFVIDGTAKTTHNLLRQIAGETGATYERFELANQSSSGTAVEVIDDASTEATEALLQIGAEAAESRESAEILAKFFYSSEGVVSG